MGKVFLKLAKPNDKKDGIPTDSIASVDVTPSSETFNITGYDTDDTDGRKANPRIALCNKVKVFNAAGAEIADKGATLVGIVIADAIGSDTGQLDEIRVKTRGSGLPLTGVVARVLKDGGSDYTNADHYEEFPVTMGTGDPETELILIAKDGNAVGRQGGGVNELFINVDNKGDLPIDWQETQYFKNFWKGGTGDEFTNVNEVKIFDPYKKKVDYTDVQNFVKGPLLTTAASLAALKSIKSTRSSIAQVNKLGQAQADFAGRQNIILQQGYESDCILAEQQAVDDYYLNLENWQTSWNTDITSMSLFPEQGIGPIMDPVWTAAVRAVSNIFDRYRELGFVIPAFNAIPNTALIDRFEDVTGQAFPTMGSPQYPGKPQYLNESWNNVQEPAALKTYEKIAKGFIIKTICFAAIATLGSIYSSLTGKSGTVSTKSSAGRITNAARLWKKSKKDGFWLSWYKTEMRSHDLFSILKSIFSAIGGLVGSIGKQQDYPGQSPDQFNRLNALIYHGVSAGYVESLKNTYDLLGRWVAFYENNQTIPKGLEASIGVALDNKSVQNNYDRFFQRISILRGKIALLLDELAFSFQAVPGLNVDGRKIQPIAYLKSRSSFSGDEKGDLLKDNAKAIKLKNGDELGSGWFSWMESTEEERSYSIKPVSAFATTMRGNGLDIQKDEQVFPCYGLETYRGSNAMVGGAPDSLPQVLIKANQRGLIQGNSRVTDRGNEEVRHFFVYKNASDVGHGPINLQDGRFDQDVAAIIRIPPRYWFRPDNAYSLSMIAGREEWVDDDKKPELSEAMRGRNEEINGGYASEDVFKKYEHIYNRLKTETEIIFGLLQDDKHIFTKIISYLSKNIGTSRGVPCVDQTEFDQLIQVLTFTPQIGKCSDEEVQKIDDELANTFFRDPGAYQVKLVPQRAKEALCKKQSCGVAHVYTQPAQINEQTELTSDKVNMEGVPMCGNVTIKYNLHPTTESSITKENQRGFFSNIFSTSSANSNAIISSLRIKGGFNASWVDAPYESGEGGDISIPPVFGNWTYAFENQRDGKSGGFLRRAAGTVVKTFAELMRVITLGIVATGSLQKDPRITNPINNYHKNLLIAYNTVRLFRKDKQVYTDNSGNPADSSEHLAPDKTDGKVIRNGQLWGFDQVSNYSNHHVNILKTAYREVVNAGGYNMVKKAIAGELDIAGGEQAIAITPLLSIQQTFSGLCYPVIKSMGINKRPIRRIVGEGTSLGTWGPTSNTEWQKHEEWFAGRSESHPGAGHLPPEGKSLGNADDSSKRESGPKGLRANHDVFISEYPFFQPITQAINTEINNLSKKVVRVDIEDINIITEIRASGLLAGGNNPLTTEIAKSNSTKALQENYCIDVNGYYTEANAARNHGGSTINGQNYGGGGWQKNGEGTERAFDSVELKNRYAVPWYEAEVAFGNSYISGAQAAGTGQAYTNAEAEYETYRKYVNVFHVTGSPVFKTGIRSDVVGAHEFDGYHATDQNLATQSAFDQLDAVEAWQTARDQFDSEGNRLARSGIKSTERINVEWSANGTDTPSCNGKWVIKDTTTDAPIEPNKYETVTATWVSKGHNEDAANNKWTTDKCNKCGEGLITSVTGPTAITFSGSITGVGSTEVIALTNAMNALNTYSNTQYSVYGSGLNQSRGNPVNTLDNDPYNFFTTGATTYSTTSGAAPLALFSPYDSSLNGSHNAYASMLLQKAIDSTSLDNTDICFGDISDPAGVASMSWSEVERTCSASATQTNYAVVDTNSSTYTNWITATDALRNGLYQAVRQRLTQAHHNERNDDGGGATMNNICTSSTGTYSFDDIDSSIVVFPNTGALCSVETANSNINWDGSHSCGAEPDWATAGLKSAAEARTMISVNDGSTPQGIINLKDFTNGTGDKNIYVLEDSYLFSSEVASDTCENAGGDSPSNGTYLRTFQRYTYRTAIFAPESMSNISGAILGGGGGSRSVSTTALIAPVVKSGNGECGFYDSSIFKTTITGDYSDVDATAFLPLLRNEYDVKAAISGSIPTVTGTCDWSSKHKQIWSEENVKDTAVNAANPVDSSEFPAAAGGHPALKIPQHINYTEQGEKYYLKYPDGINGLQSTWLTTGNVGLSESEKEAINKLVNSLDNPSTKKPAASDNRESTTEVREINELVTDDVSKKQSSKYFLGGWPIKNQKSTQLDVQKSEDTPFSAFTNEYIILTDSDSVLGEKTVKAFIDKSGVGKNKKIKAVSSKKGNSILERMRTSFSNLEAVEVETLTITYENNAFTWDFEGSKTRIHESVLFQNQTKTRDHVVQELKNTNGVYIFLYYKITFNPSACQTCVATDANEILDTDGEPLPVMVYNENYHQFMQVDWELRSGNWAFEVPYSHPDVKFDGTEISDGLDGKKVTKQWYDYITSSFVASSEQKYTGHYTAFMETFPNFSTQMACPEVENQKSQMDKIVDFQIGLGKDASYTTMKNAGKNEIISPKNSNT